MTFIPDFFKNVHANQPLAIPIIEPKNHLEKTLDQFLKSSLASVEIGQLDDLMKALEAAADPTYLEIPQLYAEYIKNQKALHKLLQLLKLPSFLTQEPSTPFSKVKDNIKALLKRNEKLVKISEKNIEVSLNKSNQMISKLLRKATTQQLDNWSTVTEALYERKHRNNTAKKLSMKVLYQEKIKINQALNAFQQVMRQSKNTSLKPK